MTTGSDAWNSAPVDCVPTLVKQSMTMIPSYNQVAVYWLLICLMALHCRLAKSFLLEKPSVLPGGRLHRSQPVVVHPRRAPSWLFQQPQQQQSASSNVESRQATRRKQLRQEGGLFSFNTKYGALNPFAIYYGLVAILLGVPWFVALTTYQVLRALTGGRLDKRRKIPVLMNHVWGTLLMRLTRSFPVMENKHLLKEFYKE